MSTDERRTTMPPKEGPYKVMLSEEEIPTSWYNIQADLPTPLPPPLHPGTREPLGPEDLAPLFPMELIKQEMSQERYIEIPDEVREVYKLYRPTPLRRAYRLERELDTPAKGSASRSSCGCFNCSMVE